MATSQSSDQVESMAAEILTLGIYSIEEKMHEDKVLIQIVQKLTGNIWAFNKFLSIFEVVLCNHKCDYLSAVVECILEVFKHIEVFSVFCFFKTICSESNYAHIQRCLIDQKFDRMVFDELQRELCSESTNTEKVRNIMEVVNSWASSEVFSPSLKDYRLSEVLNMDWGDDAHLLDTVWATINTIYNSDTAPFLQGLFSNVIDIMCSPYDTLLSYRVSAIQVLTKMIKLDEVLIPFFIEHNIQSTVLRLVIQFPEHSFLQAALLDLCELVFSIPGMQDMFAEALIPPIMREALKKSNRTIREVGFRMIDTAYRIGKTNKAFGKKLKKIGGFVQFVDGPLKNRRKLLKKEAYGGKLPKGWQNQSSSLSPE